MPDELTIVRGQDIPEVMNDLAAELKARAGGEEQSGGAPPIFLFIHGLHKFKKLRHEDDFSFSTDRDAGAESRRAIHRAHHRRQRATASTSSPRSTRLNNVNRFMNRKALSEFDMRVLFQMSANDSASLIDSPKASNLGLHRALFYNEHEGPWKPSAPTPPRPPSGWRKSPKAKPPARLERHSSRLVPSLPSC